MMTPSLPDDFSGASDDDVDAALLTTIERTANRSVDEATIHRVIERALRLQSAPQSETEPGTPPRRSTQRGTQRAPRRSEQISRWTSVAAAALCAVTVSWLLLSANKSGFAQVQQKLANLRTIQFTFRAAGSDEDAAGKVYVVQPDRVREELPDGRVFVTDVAGQQVLHLNPGDKMAESYPLYTSDHSRRMSQWVALLRDASAGEAEIIGRREVDGRQVTDYLIVSEALSLTLKVTIDDETDLPTRVEQLNPLSHRVLVVANDFVFDEPIDERLVSMAAPDGFEVVRVSRAVGGRDAELVVGPEGLGPVTWGMKKSEVIEHLGEPDGVKPFDVPILRVVDGVEQTIGRNVGEELIYDSRGFRIVLHAEEGVESLDVYGAGRLGGRSQGFAGRTDSQLRMGATRDEVVQACGEPERVVGLTQGVLNGRLDYPKQGLQFSIFDDRLSHVHVVCPRLRPDKDGRVLIRIEPPADE